MKKPEIQQQIQNKDSTWSLDCYTRPFLNAAQNFIIKIYNQTKVSEILIFDSVIEYSLFKWAQQLIDLWQKLFKMGTSGSAHHNFISVP